MQMNRQRNRIRLLRLAPGNAIDHDALYAAEGSQTKLHRRA
jgi:hypothetical protein